MSVNVTAVEKTAEKYVMRRPFGEVNQIPTPSRDRSMYGMVIMNTIQIVGTMTPARPLSMCRRSSCRLSRYHGAFDGFGVQSGVEWSWSGALNAAEMMKRPMDQSIATMNSMTRRCGQ